MEQPQQKIQDYLLKFVKDNGCLDPAIQKGCLSLSGCLEHTAITIYKRSKKKKINKNLMITWLDIYGVIPLNMIIIMLCIPHVAENCSPG